MNEIFHFTQISQLPSINLSELLALIYKILLNILSREPLLKGRLSTVDLLVLLARIISFYIKILNFFFYKTNYPNEEVNRTKPSPSVRAPCFRPFYLFVLVAVFEQLLSIPLAAQKIKNDVFVCTHN
jgi:hypothetical protein